LAALNWGLLDACTERATTFMPEAPAEQYRATAATAAAVLSREILSAACVNCSLAADFGQQRAPHDETEKEKTHMFPSYLPLSLFLSLSLSLPSLSFFLSLSLSLSISLSLSLLMLFTWFLQSDKEEFATEE
jgi:hypothetical protein